MKNILLVLMSLVFVNIATAKPRKADRKPAETHGGVAISNAQYEKAVNYALSEAGTILRVISVVKRIDCSRPAGSVFEIRYGSMNSQSGKESIDPISEKKLIGIGYPENDENDTGPLHMEFFSVDSKSCK